MVKNVFALLYYILYVVFRKKCEERCYNLVASVVTLHVQANPFVKIELTIQMRYLPRSLPNNVHSWLTNVQKIFSQQVLEPSTFAQFSTQVARHLFLTSDSSKRAFFTFRKTWSIWSDFCVCLVDLCDFCHSVHLDMAPTHAINVFIIIFGCAFIAKRWCSCDSRTSVSRIH